MLRKAWTTIELSYGEVTITSVYAMGEQGAIYTLEDDLHHGKILIENGYYLEPDRASVMISLGGTSDGSGYGLTGVEMGDWLLGGVTLVSLLPNSGDEMTPHAHPRYPDRFPLRGIEDPDARSDAAELLSALAEFYFTRAGHRSGSYR